uniref:Sugar phosphate transporter domain-containing protein n=1 Tax=Phaeomonas parva TaxID=124430 RepID=A0A6U4IW91_9STRA|mmetsp:Transcript_41748/g.130749  ORF Transcript_41748/g.130749 Transcript_41748/m.130749 type:complete len:350 (+) Transcript_41748:2116-3165(+)
MGGPTQINAHLRTIALVTLVLQNTALVICMRLSRTTEGPVYYASTAVATMEVMKFMVCVGFVVNERGWGGLYRAIAGRPGDILRLAVPSLLYTVQNNLLYFALSNLDAAIYQVSYQIKILTTALFSVFMLNRHISRTKWLALLVLTAGVAAVQLAPQKEKAAAVHHGEEEKVQSPFLGFIAVVLASVTSGFCGVYFEKIIKGSSETLWARNVQMGITSVVLAFFSVASKDGAAVWEHGFFHGYTGVVWSVVFLQALGGLTVAMVTKYANTILKCFATSISIICISIVSVFMFDLQINTLFVAGSMLVTVSVFLYNESLGDVARIFVKPKEKDEEIPDDEKARLYVDARV